MEKDFSKEQVSAKRKELDKLKENLRVKLDNSSQEKLTTFFEAKKALKWGSFWFVQRQVDKLKTELKKKLSNKEIESICQVYDELNKLIFVANYPSPKRGEIYWIIFDGENVGTEINGKKRLGLIISNNWYNEDYKRVAVLPISSKVENVYPFEVYAGKIVDEKSKIMCDQIKSFDKWRLRKHVGKLSERLIQKVEEKLKEFLLLNDEEEKFNYLFFNDC